MAIGPTRAGQWKGMLGGIGTQPATWAAQGGGFRNPQAQQRRLALQGDPNVQTGASLAGNFSGQPQPAAIGSLQNMPSPTAVSQVGSPNPYAPQVGRPTTPANPPVKPRDIPAFNTDGTLTPDMVSNTPPVQWAPANAQLAGQTGTEGNIPNLPEPTTGTTTPMPTPTPTTPPVTTPPVTTPPVTTPPVTTPTPTTPPVTTPPVTTPPVTTPPVTTPPVTTPPVTTPPVTTPPVTTPPVTTPPVGTVDIPPMPSPVGTPIGTPSGVPVGATPVSLPVAEPGPGAGIPTTPAPAPTAPAIPPVATPPPISYPVPPAPGPAPMPPQPGPVSSTQAADLLMTPDPMGSNIRSTQSGTLSPGRVPTRGSTPDWLRNQQSAIPPLNQTPMAGAPLSTYRGGR